MASTGEGILTLVPGNKKPAKEGCGIARMAIEIEMIVFLSMFTGLDELVE